MFQNLKKRSYSRPRSSALLFMSAILMGGYSVHAELEILDGVAVIVNDSVVMVSEIEREYELTLADLAAKGATNFPPKDQIFEQITEKLILESIQIQEAGWRGIVVSDEEVTAAVRQTAREQFDMSIEEFRELLAEEGVPYQQFREDLHREALLEKVQQRLVGPRVYISAQDVETFRQLPYFDYLAADRFRVGHILIAHEDSETSSANELQTRVKDLVEELRDGADFATMAVNHSVASTALEGGDLEWRRAEELPQLFVEEVLKMEVGDVSDPIRNERGLHIIKLLDKQTATRDQEETWVRHILIRPNAIKTEVAAKQELEEIRQQIVDGEDFEELARQHSDHISAREGGDIGWTNGERLDPIFLDV
ncbi:MAG: hypothetical protein F4W92_01780, partial [Gammaproteobacteria bacterium]|nr:hypothetical protein [Gammaproteobacteria bacterium]